MSYYILDPGALLASAQMSPRETGPAYTALPHAPVVPDPVRGAGALRRTRHGLAAALEALAGKVRPYEPACRPAVRGL